MRITLDAKPSAWVTVAGESHGRTPVTLDLPRGDAPIRVRFARKGYEAVVREVRPTGDATVAVTLEKEPGEDFIVPTP
ncbi:MAG: PEGA domain-containing protein [Deltaproteobacteria bacterium]|nr:PEGA domain-containing protein [Deltaproteobacteria bacterium]